MVGKLAVHEGRTYGLCEVDRGCTHENARHEMSRRRDHRVYCGLLDGNKRKSDTVMGLEMVFRK